ncbi:coiled-coil and C2 domain-containing protein 1-like [Nilaparvata lugens]|uniref:coiled-coil and C2 domain-containing protein 1-like n=1 Tax=Nilaparvata lugens TaxID=108931 RepID=UPI00193D8FDC|nr:coiled-coil and C2 domain-containing protein 1-like [Nilaparvata lugens]
MFSKKKETSGKKPRTSGGLAQYGLMDIPNIGNFDNMNDFDGDDDDDDDADLEAELMALTSESAPARRKPKPKAAPLPPEQLDRLVAASLRDVPSDESAGDDDDDDDDPELLAELGGLIGSEEADEPVESVPESKSSTSIQVQPAMKQALESTIAERLAMYQQAEANAKATGDSSRARRLGRGIKTLSDLLKQAKSGRQVNEADIPPPVVVQMTAPRNVPPAQEQTEWARKQMTDTQYTKLMQLSNQLSNQLIHPLLCLQDELHPPPQEDEYIILRPAPPPEDEYCVLRRVPSRTPVKSPQDDDSSPPPVPSRNPVRSPTAFPPPPVPTEAPPIPPRFTDPSSLVRSLSATAESDPARTVQMLTYRRNAYKLAALKAKKAGDVDGAVKYLKVSKQFDKVIEAAEEGKTVDLSEMPPPPDADEGTVKQQQSPSFIPTVSPKQQDEKQHSADQPPMSVQPAEEQQPETAEVYEVNYSSVGEALEARLKLYESQEAAAQQAENSRKARQMGRIVKQYKDAIRLNNAGKPIPVDELPNPPGYAPIPVKGSAIVKPPPSAPVVPTAPASTSAPPPEQPTKSQPESAEDKEAPPKENVRKKAGSRVERQLSLLTLRQKEFKVAALEAKKNGEINQAKEYLRVAKGFDALIEASNNGLPVDMDTVPAPPSAKEALETEFDVVLAEECVPNSDTDIYVKLESDLVSQLKMCMQTRNHFKAIGDVASANRFEQLALNTKKDLDVVKVSNRKNDPVPRFHYETKSFSIVQCNTDLTDNDLQLTIVQGVNYCVPNPKEVDTYVRFEFPFPSDNPPKDKTVVIYNTNNPIYNAVFTLPIQRNRTCQRVFKRQSIKCEIWSKGLTCSSFLSWFRCFCHPRGFFRGDTLLGTATVKLQPLETKCTIHDSFDLMEGRKAVGGKLEVKVRIRNPIVTKQVEQVNEKWLVIDH